MTIIPSSHSFFHQHQKYHTNYHVPSLKLSFHHLLSDSCCRIITGSNCVNSGDIHTGSINNLKCGISKSTLLRSMNTDTISDNSNIIATDTDTDTDTNTNTNTNSNTTPSNNKKRRVVIVGAGVGGLAIASRIASSNKNTEVIILEKNERTNGGCGGRCGSFHRKILKNNTLLTFRHERGPSLLLLRDAYDDLFRDCTTTSKNMEDDNQQQQQQPSEPYGLSILKCSDPAYRVIFDDGDSVGLGFTRSSNNSNNNNNNTTNVPLKLSNAEIKSRNWMNSIETNGATKWDSYMKTCQAFLECGLPNFVEGRLDIPSFPNFIKEALGDGFKVRFPLYI